MKKWYLSICWALLIFSGAGSPIYADPSAALLQLLVERSDLVVVATPQAACGMCLSNGPYPNGVTPTPRYETFYPQLKVDRVLKGDISSEKTFSINYTVLRFESKDPPQKFDHKFHFKIDPSPKADELALPGAPLKETQYIFFLENREKHDPKSSEALGSEKVVYRTFDFNSGMIPASKATIAELSK